MLIKQRQIEIPAKIEIIEEYYCENCDANLGKDKNRKPLYCESCGKEICYACASSISLLKDNPIWCNDSYGVLDLRTANEYKEHIFCTECGKKIKNNFVNYMIECEKIVQRVSNELDNVKNKFLNGELK